MLRGKIAKRQKEARKGLSSNLGKKLHQIYQQKKATKGKINKLTLPIPSKPSMKRNQKHIKHTIIQRWRTHRTHTHAETKQNKTKQKIKNKPSSKNQKALHIYIIGKKICCPSVLQ